VSQTSRAINIGAEGLDLAVRLRQVTAAGEASVLPAGDVVISELGDGDYMLSGLPDAGGTDRVSVFVFIASEPARALYSYDYGAEPGTTVIFRQEVAAVTGSTLVEDDTFGTVQVVVRSGLPSNIGSGTATFSASNSDTGAAIVSTRPAVISNVVQDVSTGSWGATLTYQVEAAVTANPLTLDAEFRVTLPGGATLTLPQQQTLRITVRRKL
jgi:hypothetical protein